MKKILISITLFLFSISNLYAGSVCQQIRSGQDCGAGNSVMAGLNCAPNVDPGDPNASSVASWDAYCLSLDHGSGASGVYCPSTNFNDAWNTPASCTCDTGWAYNSGTHDCDTCASGYIDIGGICVSELLLYVLSSPADLYVATTGNDITGNGSVGNPFATITRALEAALDVSNAAVTIYVGSGPFTDPIAVKKFSTDTNNYLPTYITIVGTTTELLSSENAEAASDNNTIVDTGRFVGGPDNYKGNFVEILAGPNYIDLLTYPWFTNIYPILSNDDDSIELPNFDSDFDATTSYRIIENSTIIDGGGDSFHFGITNLSGNSVRLFVRSLELTGSWYGVLNSGGNTWVQGCSFPYDTTGYSAVHNQNGGTLIVDGSYFTGDWLNAGVGSYDAARSTVRYNFFDTTRSAIDNENTNNVFLYSNVIDAPTQYAIKCDGDGTVTESGSAITHNIFNDAGISAFYAVNGCYLDASGAHGSGNVLIATVGGGSTVLHSNNLTGISNYNILDSAGRIINSTTGDTFISGDVLNYVAENDGNPEYRIGASDNEEFHIQSVYDAGTQSLDHVHLTTESESADANQGKWTIGVDEVDVLDVDDLGINLLDSAFSYRVNGSEVYYSGGTDVAVADGGTGASNAADAASNLGVGLEDTPSFSGETIVGANGSSFGIRTASEVITVPELVNTADSSAGFLPANSFIIGVATYVTDATIAPAQMFDLGPSAGTSDLYVNDGDAMNLGATTNMYADGATFQHMSNYFLPSADKATVVLSGANPAGNSFSVRVVIWYYQITSPTS